MKGPFRIDLAGVGVELGGNTVVLDKDNRQDDRPGEFLDYFRCEEYISHTENYAVLEGNPENGVTVEVLEHVFRDNMMITVIPFSTKNGIRKFSSENDLYVVFSKDGRRRIYVMCHRKFPTGIIIWDAGSQKKLPAEKSEGKPLAVNLDLSSIPLIKVKPDNGDGHKPSDELDQATKDAIAGEQCDHGTGKSGDRRPKGHHVEV